MTAEMEGLIQNARQGRTPAQRLRAALEWRAKAGESMSMMVRSCYVQREDLEALVRDSERLDWISSNLFPLPWGGVFLLAEGGQDLEDGTSEVSLSLSPSSADAPVWSHTRPTLRDAIDAARGGP
jgi:hypothetical protein